VCTCAYVDVVGWVTGKASSMWPIICVMTCLAILQEHQFMTERWMGRHRAVAYRKWNIYMQAAESRKGHI